MTMPVAFSTLDVRTTDGDADSYLARPDDGGPHPGVLFYMDAYGLRPYLREMMEAIAANGFTVLAPNVFYRSGRAPVLPMPESTDPAGHAKFFAALGPKRAAFTPDKALADAQTYLDWLSAAEFVAPGPVAVTGYCMGGRLALRTAGAFGNRIAAAASFHGGRLAVDDQPDSPHHAAAGITAELLIAHASQDDSMPPEQIARLDKALDAAHVHYTSVVYPNTRHGFTMRDTPVFDQAAYDRHLADLLALLRRAQRAR
ncbi:dienelactone hydrolase family protein [Nocardia sp. NPDC004604]|uniref:dienelactone hydrolase family protein n=1 Tax=Nocardia sp. NPDC004604 TaxID=3157013 RepID=UPI0033B05F0C